MVKPVSIPQVRDEVTQRAVSRVQLTLNGLIEELSRRKGLWKKPVSYLETRELDPSTATLADLINYTITLVEDLRNKEVL